MQLVQQARAPQHFGVQAFGGQEHDGEVGGVRRRHVFAGDQPRLQFHRAAQRGAGGFHAIHVGGVLSVHQPFVFFLGKFGVDRQPHGRAAVAPSGQADGELDHRIATRHGLDVAGVLVGRHVVFNQAGQLHLAPGAARLHVGQHALQVAHARRQRLHLAQAFVHGLQPVRHQFERLAQALLQRGMQLFVHGAAHFIELGAVIRLQ
ncbi:hypothetical protein D3C73_996890 [compost metagenome]